MKAAPLSKKQEKSLCLLIVYLITAIALDLFVAERILNRADGMTSGTVIVPRASFGDIM